jgi:pyruvate kinase
VSGLWTVDAVAEPTEPDVTNSSTRTKATRLHARIDALIRGVTREREAAMAAWAVRIEQPRFAPSADNLACYLALRRRELTPLQAPLMALGLSSLGRLESRVMPGLVATRAALAALAGLPEEPMPTSAAFFAGERLLEQRALRLFGPPLNAGTPALLVTCPSEAADEPEFATALAKRGVEAVRINCAHDGPDAWLRMIGHVRAAAHATGRPIKVLMDLGGPKIRTGEIAAPKGRKRIGTGDVLAIVPPGGLAAISQQHAAVECTLPEALVRVAIGDRVFVDDGKLAAEVEAASPGCIVARVTRADEEGFKLKPEKGLGFPDTELAIPALTDKDRADLEFVAQHADGVEFSFVQTVEDVEMLQQVLAELRPHNWRELALILKIETAKAVRNLPELLVQSAGHQPTGVMIARGDLAVQIGFVRMAEMQEEILWICEAAHVPVIWATQVLENLVKTGLPSRGEMTDAAMAARAECVMLNKGPFLLEAIDQLRVLLARMEQHQYKKAPRLRRLKSW